MHSLLLNLQELTLHSKDEKSFYWVAQDFAEEEPSRETFAIRFKTPEIATEFQAAFSRAQVGLVTNLPRYLLNSCRNAGSSYYSLLYRLSTLPSVISYYVGTCAYLLILVIYKLYFTPTFQSWALHWAF